MPVTWMWWHTGHEGAVWEDRKGSATFHCLCTIPQSPGPIRIMLNLLCWCSLTEINKTTKPKRCHICLQHGLLNIWSPLLNRTAQKKIVVFQLCNCVRLSATPWTAADQASRPLPSPAVCANPCALSRWCHATISSSVIPCPSCLQFFPASGSFPSESALCIRCSEYWSFNISPSSEFRVDFL